MFQLLRSNLNFCNMPTESTNYVFSAHFYNYELKAGCPNLGHNTLLHGTFSTSSSYIMNENNNTVQCPKMGQSFIFTVFTTTVHNIYPLKYKKNNATKIQIR